MANFSYYIQNKVCIIQIRGEIIAQTIYEIKQDMNPLVEDVKNGVLSGIVMDCQNVTHIDSAGFGAICAKFIALKKLNSKLAVVNLNSTTGILFEVLELTQVFETQSSVQSLIHKIGPSNFDAEVRKPQGNWRPSPKPSNPSSENRSLKDMNLKTVILKPERFQSH